MKFLKVLVVDDSVLTVKKLTAMIESVGHRVVATASTGAQALDAYRDSKPDLVTMDITMPDMDGVQATKLLVGQHPDANVIMVTSHGQEKMVIDALNAGARGYVLKPIKPEKLHGMIAKVMNRKS